MGLFGYDGSAIAQVVLRCLDVQKVAKVTQLTSRIGNQLLEIHVMYCRSTKLALYCVNGRAACEVVVDLAGKMAVCIFSAPAKSLAKGRGDGIEGVSNDVNELLGYSYLAVHGFQQCGVLDDFVRSSAGLSITDDLQRLVFSLPLARNSVRVAATSN